MSEDKQGCSLPIQELGDSDSPATLLSGMPELCVSDGSLAVGDPLSLPPTVEAAKQPIGNSVEERQITALETQAKALESISTFLSGITLKEVLQHTAVHSAAAALLGGLTSKDGRQGLDARAMKQNAIDISYLLEAVLSKLSSHASSRKEVQDGEELQKFPKD